MNITKKQLSTWIISTVLIIAIVITGIFVYESIITKKDQPETEQKIDTVSITFKENGKKLSYEGKSGKTALELLTEGTEVTMSGSNENAYVTGINGVEANASANEFWAFYINGESAMVGAGSYKTLDSDVISWELTNF